jgi:hypothetical protein
MSMFFTENASGLTFLPSTDVVFDSSCQVTPDKYDQSYCLGGYPHVIPILPKVIAHQNSLLKYCGYNYATKLCRDFTSAELTSGKTIYRCYFLGFAGDDAVENLYVHLTQPATGVAVSIWVDTATAGATERITGETVAPSGASWTTPTSGAKQLIATSFDETNSPIAIWFKVVVTVGAAAKMLDTYSVTFTSDNYEDLAVKSYVNRRNDSTIYSVTSDREGKLTGQAGRIIYTILCKTSAGTLTDLPSGLWVVIESDTDQASFIDSNTNTLQRFPVVVGYGTKTATGTYTYEFTPWSPGFYTINFFDGETVMNYKQHITPCVR